MIISPRAKEVINVLRTANNLLRKVDEVFLLRRRGMGSPYRKISYWKRGINTGKPPLPEFKSTSFAMVPKMTAAISKGCAVYGTDTAWRSFNRDARVSGTFGTNSWVTVTFSEARTVRGWALQYASAPSPSPFTFAIEGKSKDDEWIRISTTSVNSLVNNGYFGTTDEMECTAVRIRVSHATAVRSCQFFEREPLVPVTMTAYTGNGVTLVFDPNTPINTYRYQCFTHQSNAISQNLKSTHGSNRGMPSSKGQNRFEIRFNAPKTVCGFSVGGLASYTATNCYANCLLIEGRESDDDYWRKMDEVDFNPALQETQYFDFAVDHVVGQLRITVQDITSGTSQQVYLPPMQVWGRK